MADKIYTIIHHAKLSEKAIEIFLVEIVNGLGGICLKFSSQGEIGYPDRLVILPNGVTAWFELKSKGKHPTPLQMYRHRQLEKLGQKVYVCDNKDEIVKILRSLTK